MDGAPQTTPVEKQDERDGSGATGGQPANQGVSSPAPAEGADDSPAGNEGSPKS